jgi:hypothetical protein
VIDGRHPQRHAAGRGPGGREQHQGDAVATAGDGETERSAGMQAVERRVDDSGGGGGQRQPPARVRAASARVSRAAGAAG